MKLTEHFDSTEFDCTCGCGTNKTKIELVRKLEELFDYMDAASIPVNSGTRCPKHSLQVKGSANDGHVRGIAADIRVKKKDKSFYTGADIAEAAERLGFTGIGIISADSCHLDIRSADNYENAHWFGNEMTNENFIKTFQRGTIFPGEGKAPAKEAAPEETEKVTTKEEVKKLQEALNKCGAGLVVDGIAGSKTLAAAKKHRIDMNVKSDVVKWVQDKLKALGFDCGATDGISGRKTMNAVYEWQRAHKLGVGALYGSDWETLLK